MDFKRRQEVTLVIQVTLKIHKNDTVIFVTPTQKELWEAETAAPWA